MVNGKEKFRATTCARCQRFIEWHHPIKSEVVSRNSEVEKRSQQQVGSLKPEDASKLPPTSDLRLPTSEEVAEAPTILEISFSDQEAFVGDYLVASISYDHGNYQNLYWRVLVNNVEIFRDLSAARCHSYIKQQYQQGTLPVQEQLTEEAEGLLAGSKREEISPLHPAPCSLSSSTTPP